MFNPYQYQNLMKQKEMIDAQLNAMQMPNININNMTQPNNYDFNGRWVNSADEAKGIANNNLPLILFDRNNPIFYMKNMDGSFKTYKFEEVIEQPQISSEQKILELEEKINAILGALQPNTGKINTDKAPKEDK